MSYIDDDYHRDHRSRNRNNPAAHMSAGAPYPDYSNSNNANSSNHYPRGDMMDDFGPETRGRPAAAPGLDASADPHLPPRPPLGETLKPALKRENSRSRLAPNERPQFPDEASYLGGRAPDLEAKNRPRDQKFRDLRDGYESEEGENHKGSKYTPRNKMPRSNDDDLAYDDRKRRPRRNDYPPPDSAISGTTRGGGGYDDPPPRRRRDRDERPQYDDDYPPPRRRGDRPPPVEYGAEPIPSRQKSERRPRPRRDYDDYSDEEDYRPRRRRGTSADGGHGRRPRDYDDGPYYSDEPRRRRDDDYDRAPARRRDSSRRRRDDYDDYDRYDDRDRDRRGGRDSKTPKEIKIGKYDIGPWVEKGQKHWTTIAPILTPIVLAQIRKMGSGGGGGGGGRR
ncbi:hypothetical protein Slin15195_G003290 [Septoria linicola]|uniref:Uncharacterized protein n=1 Tax=Septoria linicola TaxID=215465 RepID=A0A9Q9EDN9_9PEZI|nr:hypothetical protein Slin14017_G003320 [Septoria linicola]USW47010.1 hypothetical protein Slin15195_G003290 [Septoria linicola]